MQTIVCDSIKNVEKQPGHKDKGLIRNAYNEVIGLGNTYIERISKPDTSNPDTGFSDGVVNYDYSQVSKSEMDELKEVRYMNRTDDSDLPSDWDGNTMAFEPVIRRLVSQEAKIYMNDMNTKKPVYLRTDKIRDLIYLKRVVELNADFGDEWTITAIKNIDDRIAELSK